MIPRAVHAYTAAILVLAFALVAFVVPRYPIDAVSAVIVLMALTFVTENFALQLPVVGLVSLSFAFNYAALLIAGPFAAILTAWAGSISIVEYRAQKPLVLQLFNVGQLTLSAGMAGLAYVIAGGSNIVGSATGVSVTPLPSMIAPLAFFTVNVLLVSHGASLLTGQKFRDVMRVQGFISYGVSLFVLALLGLMVASLMTYQSWIGLSLLVLPFMAARRTFRVYAELTEAYTATVRSLVTAIEAKDPYTRGHSERVAVYARSLAERLGASRLDVELLERAGLLHDVGKIGIPLDTLVSPNSLSLEETCIIREHPLVGSRLVGDVEFLADTVPIILHHHERIDGGGYPAGLTGDDIPRLSRMLAIADSYDAMVSDRAYRLGMTKHEAIAEMRRVSGIQLDSAMTEQFIAMLDEQTVQVPQ